MLQLSCDKESLSVCSDETCLPILHSQFEKQLLVHYI